MGRKDTEFAAGRDASVLRLVTILRFVRAEHVAAVHFNGRLRVANRRLKALTDQRRLRRVRHVKQGPWVYCLPGTRLTRFMYEALEIADVYTSVVVHRPSGGVLHLFEPWWEAGPIRPDALTVLSYGGKAWATFVEWDSGTVHIDRVASKVDGYRKWVQEERYRDASWWREGLPMAVVMATPNGRVQSLQTAVAARGKAPVKVVSHEALLGKPWQMLKPPG